MIKAIVFDCFGVLVGQGFDTTYRLAGGDPVADRSFVSDILGQANLGLISSQEMTQQICDRLHISEDVWREAVTKSEQPDEHLLAYAEGLKHRYKIAVLSNANKGTLQRKFTPEQLGIFDAVVVSAEVGLIKPSKEIYELAAERLGVQPNECVFVDDNQTFCDGAEAAGMISICYAHFSDFNNQLEAILDHN